MSPRRTSMPPVPPTVPSPSAQCRRGHGDWQARARWPSQPGPRPQRSESSRPGRAGSKLPSLPEYGNMARRASEQCLGTSSWPQGDVPRRRSEAALRPCRRASGGNSDSDTGRFQHTDDAKAIFFFSESSRAPSGPGTARRTLARGAAGTRRRRSDCRHGLRPGGCRGR